MRAVWKVSYVVPDGLYVLRAKARRDHFFSHVAVPPDDNTTRVAYHRIRPSRNGSGHTHRMRPAAVP